METLSVSYGGVVDCNYKHTLDSISKMRLIECISNRQDVCRFHVLHVSFSSTDELDAL